ncbi:hypothetical protein DFH07DRAFT_1023264 [Mycena maculata]|uniref:Uncharacterized protein n=1 Tax=Mycena maculata TaxID=230809 RepID=A0AAD7J974_9AGAR|nr:hypothetical protein DFH07DRAFT_1023264 [Mycena maculata]
MAPAFVPAGPGVMQLPAYNLAHATHVTVPPKPDVMQPPRPAPSPRPAVTHPAPIPRHAPTLPLSAHTYPRTLPLSTHSPTRMSPLSTLDATCTSPLSTPNPTRTLSVRSHQPSRHYAPSAILDPLAPYYLGEQRHGSLGPTPPLSAALSPSESVALDISHSCIEESSVSPGAHASPYPQTPSSVFGSPALPPSSYGASFTSSQSPEPDVSHIGVSEPPEWKESQSIQRPSLITTSRNWTSGFDQQEFLTLDLPNPHMNDWTAQKLDIQAFLQEILPY